MLLQNKKKPSIHTAVYKTRFETAISKHKPNL